MIQELKETNEKGETMAEERKRMMAKLDKEFEAEFTRTIEDKIKEGWYEHKEDIMTVFLALQKQNFILGNSLKNLINHWPHEEIFLIHSGQRIPNKIQPEKLS